jgi:2-desacetyl-2-hydroxyethyl bacteriochlorophyllide A dehydrogenase
MNSLYVSFPEPQRVTLCEEEIAPPAPDEVLCAAVYSLISTGTELNCLAGRFDPGTNWKSMVRYPFRPGYSMVARVVERGRDATALAVDDLITSRTPHQQYFKLPAREAYRLPASARAEEDTFVRLAGTTQLGARRAELKFGESVAVVGMGLLGQLVVQYMALAGARRVIAIDSAPGRLELARAHGATHTVCAGAAEALDAVSSITDGRMLDVVFDVTGNPAVLSPALLLLRRLGRLVLLGDTPMPTQQVLGPGVVSNSLTILGIHGTMHPEAWSEFAPWTRPEMYDLFFDFLAQGRMSVAGLITHRFPITEAPAAYDLLVHDRTSALGVVLNWGELAA